jgi:glycosyltransferase involved in cell wall biosynthesis
MLVAWLGNATEGGDRWTWSFTVHGSDEFADVVRERLREKITAASFVVAVSDFTRSQLLALVDEAHWPKVHVVRCGVDPEVYAPRDRERGAAPADGGRLEVLTVGRLSAVKGHGVLFEAIASAATTGLSVHATLVGDGPRRASLQELATRLGIADHVTFAGAVSQDEIREYYAAADVFCLSSFTEGVPVVLMEAMAMEKPVLATRVMGIPELVTDGESGLLVTPGRPDLLAEALVRLASDSDLRRRLGRSARARVSRDYDVHRGAARLRELFASYNGGDVAGP